MHDVPAALVEIALHDLVRQHRDSFAPLWTVESWAKLWIWLALRCGCPTDPASLEAFAAALPPVLSGQLRRVFFERELEDCNLRLRADPAAGPVLALPLDTQRPLPQEAGVLEALERVGLLRQVAAPGEWHRHPARIALPWRLEAPCS